MEHVDQHIHQDLRNNDRTNKTHSDRNLELDLSLIGDKYLQKRRKQERNLMRLLNERNIHDERSMDRSFTSKKPQLRTPFNSSHGQDPSRQKLNLGKNKMMKKQINNGRTMSIQTTTWCLTRTTGSKKGKEWTTTTWGYVKTWKTSSLGSTRKVRLTFLLCERIFWRTFTRNVIWFYPSFIPAIISSVL